MKLYDQKLKQILFQFDWETRREEILLLLMLVKLWLRKNRIENQFIVHCTFSCIFNIPQLIFINSNHIICLHAKNVYTKIKFKNWMNKIQRICSDNGWIDFNVRHFLADFVKDMRDFCVFVSFDYLANWFYNYVFWLIILMTDVHLNNTDNGLRVFAMQITSILFVR